MSDKTFFAELMKRRVIQVAAIYVAIAWGGTEIVVTVVEQLFLPVWVSTLAVIVFVVGFPVSMFLAWTFDITPDGIRRTTITSRRGRASIAGAMTLLIAATAGTFLLIRPGERLPPDRGNVPVVQPNSIAVLPFENVGGSNDDEYLSAGLSDELRDQLGRIAGLRIAARSSSIVAASQLTDARTKSLDLGVATLVEGSMRRRGGQLRFSVQLVDGRTGLALWSETFDRGPRELLFVQQEIVEQIVATLLPESDVEIASPSTQDVTANELMLLARYREQQVLEQPEVDVEVQLEAIRLYEEAIEADPDSALAHSRLAGARLYLGDVEAAAEPVFRALSLAPDLSEVHHTLGRYYWLRGIEGAGTALERAVDLNPNNADALHSFAYWLWMQGLGDGPTVADLYRRALALDPLSLPRHAALGEFLGHAARVDETYEVIDAIQALFDTAAGYRTIGRLYELTGDLDRAIAWTIRARDAQPDNLVNTWALADLYAEIGDFDTALALEPEPGVGLLFKMGRYDDLIEIAEFRMIDEPQDIELRYLLAFAYNATGQHESAIYILSSTGLPDTVFPEARQAKDIEAFVTLIDALDAAGETELAHGYARWYADKGHMHNANWWVNLYTGCALSILDRHDEALEKLQSMGASPRLPWQTLLEGSHCLKQYANEPRFRSMLQRVATRRAELRARLPATLRQFGVAL